jgi:hypothetical protein
MMGDIIEAGKGVSSLQIQAVGTGAIERIEFRNGLETIAAHSPYTETDLGNRVKVVWSGSEVRGRARLVPWHGGLTVEGNRIEHVTPINFWNADRPLQQIDETELAWRSVTTGGLSGILLTLSEPGVGTLHIHTEQGQIECSLEAISLEPRTWSFGGLRKELSINRLPAQPTRGPGRRTHGLVQPDLSSLFRVEQHLCNCIATIPTQHLGALFCVPLCAFASLR